MNGYLTRTMVLLYLILSLLFSGCGIPSSEKKPETLPPPKRQVPSKPVLRPVPKPTELETLHKKLHDMTLQMLKKGELGRLSNGFTYAVDIGHLLVYAALQKDRVMYDILKSFALEHLVLEKDVHPFIKGFVIWRYKKGVPKDASGTTEALRVAEGLWRGSKAFGLSKDREKSLMIVAGYVRHQYEEQGIWLIRNYFNLGTEAFVTNSFLVDYDPDFLHEVYKETKDASVNEVAMKSDELMRKAVAPSGLLYAVIQPEIGTLLPLDLAFFSPNDVIKILNSSTVAERIIHANRKIAKGVLDFAIKRLSSINAYYYGRTGEKARSGSVGPATYSSLLRLAIRLNGQEAIQKILPKWLNSVKAFAQKPYQPRLYILGEVLLAFAYLQQDQIP